MAQYSSVNFGCMGRPVKMDYLEEMITRLRVVKTFSRKQHSNKIRPYRRYLFIIIRVINCLIFFFFGIEPGLFEELRLKILSVLYDVRISKCL